MRPRAVLILTHETPEQRTVSRGGLLAMLAAAFIGGLLWIVIIAAIRWVLQLPPPALARLAAVVLLFVGSGLVFGAIVRLEGLRPPDVRRLERLHRERDRRL
jgi:amino acid transporter